MKRRGNFTAHGVVVELAFPNDPLLSIQKIGTKDRPFIPRHLKTCPQSERGKDADVRCISLAIAATVQLLPVLMGGEESGGLSIKGHIPEGDGILMGLLLLEVIARRGKPLEQLVDELEAEFGPAHYARTDLRLRRPVIKAEMVKRLRDDAPAEIAGAKVADVLTTDGVKYLLEDESWLLIRPSGTEPVLRVYAEATSEALRDGLLQYCEEIAERA